jgi:AcrR family transcriptional regulator
VTAEERRRREEAQRRALIVSAARQLAEAEGWGAVTTRRLSALIDYSQPVLYRHFNGKEAIVRAVALEGFGELAEALRTTREQAVAPTLASIQRCYAEFAGRQPRLYEAMFTLRTDLTFGPGGAPDNLQRCFAELRQSVAEVAEDRDLDTFTEIVWASLHGLVMLQNAHRMRPEYQKDRLALLVEQHLAH